MSACSLSCLPFSCLAASSRHLALPSHTLHKAQHFTSSTTSPSCYNRLFTFFYFSLYYFLYFTSSEQRQTYFQVCHIIFFFFHFFQVVVINLISLTFFHIFSPNNIVVPWFGRRIALSHGIRGGAPWHLDCSVTSGSQELPCIGQSVSRTPYVLSYLLIYVLVFRLYF